ncbi:MAG: UDP-N-acetylmuramoyl-L-alanine--D-glutamate ligase [Bacteroidales bacterium]|jgi:UDP-N-acetylmuramoylalanine--D-glutamate ligase|nr:UDP-N-acetylmuramoyl-L-alanine--D-glutamate ligase [Bacteroidales bacterium]
MMSRQEDFLRFRREFPEFIYNGYSYSINETGLSCDFSYSCGNNTFNAHYIIPQKPFFSPSSLNETQLQPFLFSIGLIELISYWKFACSPRVVIKCGKLEEAQIKFWKKLYFMGLGEFFYTNGISTTQEDFMTIECLSKDHLKPVRIDTKDEYFVPIGGGKDSVVTLEMLKGVGCDVKPLIINPRKASLDCIRIGGYSNEDLFEIKRTIDPTLLALNDRKYLNGHTPFSAMLAFASILAAALCKKRYIALSNELSANESTVKEKEINHQYSKSLDFENDFRRYVADYITKDIEYFSFLRIFELKIAEIFSQLPYKKVFRSCNVGSKADIWCGHCSKCLFAFIILSPFIEREELKAIFNKNLFALSDTDEINRQMKQDFLELCGTTDAKPFECVGTVEEVNAAIALYIKKYGVLAEDNLIRIWVDEVAAKNGQTNEDASDISKLIEPYIEQSKAILSMRDPRNLPPQAASAYDKPFSPLRNVIRNRFKEETIGIFGFGREGISTYRFLRDIFPTKNLIIADENQNIWQDSLVSKDANLTIFSGNSVYSQAADLCTTIFKTPGIPSAKFSQGNKQKISSQTDLFLQYFARQTIGITGTKGKSTTTSLIFKILQDCGVPSVLVGNIGVPMLDKFWEIDAKTIVVAELSAFQLEKITLAPNRSVFLNVFEEHLDVFSDFEAYCRAKSNILLQQAEGSLCFYNVSDARIARTAEQLAGKRLLHPVRIEDYAVYFRQSDLSSGNDDVLQPAYLKGEHNLFNIAVATEVCLSLGLPLSQIIKTCVDFRGLPHRLEFVTTIDNVDFFDDSISTTAESTIMAIKSLKNVQTILLGGKDRGINYDILADFLPQTQIKNIALIGKAGERIGKILQSRNCNFNYFVSNDFEQIVAWAKAVTTQGKAVLLSPAAPSYDQFKNFEERGETFKKYIFAK